MSLPDLEGPWWPPRRCSSAERMMWITPDRVFYAGLLGSPSMHTKGAILLYVALEGPLRIRLGHGPWQDCEVAVVQPYVAHQAACEARHVVAMYVEPESVDLARLPAFLRAAAGTVQAPEFASHVRRCHARMVAAGRSLDLQPQDFDQLVFGQALSTRVVDPRIGTVLERIKRDPAAAASAQACADQVHLSVSRFLHLFKQEVDAPFRAFRTWKRARSLLHHVCSDSALVDVALDAGYPDSTHFSHSIRQNFGLKPRDIFAGSRKLHLIGHLKGIEPGRVRGAQTAQP
jgi:AraC-like DNA-binding protein